MHAKRHINPRITMRYDLLLPLHCVIKIWKRFEFVHFVHFKSSSGQQVRTKFDHLQIVRNTHGTLKMVLIIEMLNYFLGPESSGIKIVV